MQYLHSKKLVHGDLKPSNIFLLKNSLGKNNLGNEVVKIGNFDAILEKSKDTINKIN